MQISDEIKARLNHGARELSQALQLLATVTDRIRTAFDETQVCSDRAGLIDPAIDALNHHVYTLTEEMDRVYSLRNDESDLYLRQENAKLKRDFAALQQALRREMEEHQAYLVASTKSNDELVQRAGGLERFNQLLKSRLNEMKEKYESAIIEVADLKEMKKTLQNASVFNVVANTAASGDLNSGSSMGPIPFGKTVVETNRGLTVTIESSPATSPEKASLNHGWNPEIPGGAAFPFPDIAPQPQFAGGSLQLAPSKPRVRPIVRGTQEANESFERMKRSLASSPLANSTNVIKVEDTATAVSLTSTSSLPMPTIEPIDMHPVTPSKAKSKLNPAVAAFTPTSSSGKDSAKSGSLQAFSPTTNEPKLPVTAKNTKEDGFISPHLRRLSKVSSKDEPVSTTEELPAQNILKYQDIVLTSARKEHAEGAEPRQATLLVPRTLPHLRRLTGVIKNEAGHPSQVQRSGKGENKEDTVYGTDLLSLGSALPGMKENVQAATTPGAFVNPDPGLQAWLDSQEKVQSNSASSHELASTTSIMLIEIDTNESPKAGEKKSASPPPGFIPISGTDAPAKTETTAPIKADRATSPAAVSDNAIHRTPAAENGEAAAEHKVSIRTTTEKEKNAAFLTEYTRQLSSVGEKYGRHSRKGSDVKEDAVDPIQYEGAKPSYVPSKPTGTRELGALLDDECRKMVMKPGQAFKLPEGVGQGWKAVCKGGRVVYVL